MHRADVTPFVQHQLVPALVEAYRLQSDEWGFPWYREWTSYREDIDDRRLSVALAAGKTWYHGRAPAQGHSGITLQVAGTNSAGYDTMLEGLVSTFHHELFHNHQRNLSQHLGSTADITGAGDAWAFFTEGTAILASSAGWSPTHFGPNAASHSYFSFANAFLGSGGLLTSLNSNYQQLSPYRATIYWRFLYEQCGGLAGDFEDPATGMAVIRHALITLYSRQIVDITTSTDLVGNLPAIMDRALAQTATCPFSNYEQSLLHFAQALYALRLAGGRCVRPGFPAGCGFYDPHKLYARPAVDVINYDGTPVIFGAADQMYPAGIRSSFGIDFIEVVLSPSAHGRSLTVEFDAAPGSASEFRLCLWKLRQPSTGGESVPVAPPEILTETSTDGHVIYTIPAIDISQNNRLGFIITRVDAAESEDRIGMYTIRLSR
jgi:hypothetical protein